MERGASQDQIRSYLTSRGVVSGPAPPTEIPVQPTVSDYRQRLEDRVQAGVEAGGLRTVPSPGEEEVPAGPQVGFEKLEAAALGTVLPYLQVSDLQRKYPVLASTPALTIMAQGLSEGLRIGGGEPIAESQATRAIHDALRLAEEEVAPEGLFSKEGLQVLGLEILLDPMNALPGVGFADVPEKVLTATGRRLLGKGLLGTDEFAKAWASGLSEEVWQESTRMMTSAQRAVAERQLLAINEAAGEAAKFQTLKDGLGLVGEETVKKQVINDAIQVTKERYAQEISDTSAEYFDALDQLDLFQGPRQGELGFVEGDPRLAFDDVARVPSDLSQGSLPELTVTAREATRKRLADAFPKASKKQIQEMLDESSKIATQLAEDAAEPGPPLPGGSPEAFKQRLRESFTSFRRRPGAREVFPAKAWTEDEIDAVVRAGIDESERIIQKSPQLEIPGSVGPPQTLYNTRDTLLKGLERQLAEATLMERVHSDLLQKEYKALVQSLDTSANSPLREKISAKAAQIIERDGDDIQELSRQAVERTYKTIIDKPVMPSTNDAKLLGRVGIKNFEDGIQQVVEGVSPAEMRKMGGMERMFWRMGYRLAGGKPAEFMEGMLRAVSREYADTGVRQLLTETWPELYNVHRGRVAERLFTARQAGGKLAREVARFSRESGISLDELGRQLNRARSQGKPELISDASVREAFESAGMVIDNMSNEFINDGLIPATEADKFRENMGKYLHMNYATFNLANWKKNVRDTAIWENAFEWFKRHYPEMTDQEVTGNMMYLLSNRKKIIVGKGEQAFKNSLPGNLPIQVLDELKHRTQLPDALRELMGVNKDFAANFDITTATMIHDLEVTRFHRQLLESGLQNGIIRVARDVPDHRAGVLR
jgi:hypothetical protein